ncbi:FtsW/RodA/SpoVE family cell cycle protein [Pelagibacterium xiamenense]|uniref:FtsW/RodA/SpoVE family cell cycle protein n=1 Tax=Pelagibacterium xiamenense TaxID=2901140 RepID=UPI001E44C34C|nr:putative peptidoglycan glycosyltransferase FtsW [Pelagibacterium xiamenense]MCD7060137.1 putative lipid II flippase FtsW [Pelagibacterium xiamenense]
MTAINAWFSRERKTPIAEWWWTIDRELLFALIALMAFGMLLSFAASPPVAERLGLGAWHFVARHALFCVPAIGVLIGASFLPAKWIRISALVSLIGGIGLLVLVLRYGTEVKGAHRWISLFGQTIQPSEFVKPAYAVMAAWFMSEQMKRGDVPGQAFAAVFFAAIVTLLLLQPDVGQTALMVATYGALLFLTGISWWLIGVLGGAAMGLAGLAYIFFPHVARRVDAFINPETGDNYQAERALESLLEGGWFGKGPGEGIAKRYLPDAHADFVFAAGASEFGILFCLMLVGLICFIVIRALILAQSQHSLFNRLAASALAIQFGVQSAINLTVNLNLIPPKGMTLPFVSYGGTSMIAIAFGMGLLLALTRRKPEETFATGLPIRSAVKHEAL